VDRKGRAKFLAPVRQKAGRHRFTRLRRGMIFHQTAKAKGRGDAGTAVLTKALVIGSDEIKRSSLGFSIAPKPQPACSPARIPGGANPATPLWIIFLGDFSRGNQVARSDDPGRDMCQI